MRQMLLLVTCLALTSACESSFKTHTKEDIFAQADYSKPFSVAEIHKSCNRSITNFYGCEDLDDRLLLVVGKLRYPEQFFNAPSLIDHNDNALSDISKDGILLADNRFRSDDKLQDLNGQIISVRGTLNAECPQQHHLATENGNDMFFIEGRSICNAESGLYFTDYEVKLHERQ